MLGVSFVLPEKVFRIFETCIVELQTFLQKMQRGIVKFYFQKVDGSIREAWGTLNEKYIPTTTSTNNKAKNETVQTYFDTEKQEFRCFKKLNLVSININKQQNN